MSKLKVGDSIFYKGDEGIIREVMIDGKENFYRVDVSKKSIHYLYEDELDLVTQKLNDNQQIVFEWLEEYYAKSQWPFPFYVLKHAANDMPANIFGFYDDFTMKEEYEVLAAFAQWGLEQEEVG